MSKQIVVDAAVFIYILKMSAQALEDSIALRELVDDVRREVEAEAEDEPQSPTGATFEPPPWQDFEGREKDSED